MKHIQKLFIILFMAMLCLPIMFMNIKPNQVSHIDNRKLTDIPKLDKNFPINVESYLMDRIGFRSWMIDIYQIFNDSFFHVMMHPSYMYGKEGHVFFKIKNEIYDPGYMDTFVSFLEKIHLYSQDRDIQFLYWLNPRKDSVYTEYLPNGVDLQKKNITYLKEEIHERKIPFMFSLDVLLQEKEDMLVYNKQYDVGHWNENGAFVAIRSMLQELNKNLYIPQVSDFRIDTQIYNTLPASNFKIQDESNIYIPISNNTSRDVRFDEGIQLNKNFRSFSHFVNGKRRDQPKALIFRGSYLDNKEKFLTESFSEVTFIHNYQNVINFDYYINIFRPDIVIFESADHVLNNSYFSQKDMEEATFAKPYDYFENLPYSELTNVNPDVQVLREGEIITLTLSVPEEVGNVYLDFGDNIVDMKIVKDGKQRIAKVTIQKDDFRESAILKYINRSKSQQQHYNISFS